MKGQISNVAPDDALRIANRMMDPSLMQGPQAFAKVPQLQFNFHGSGAAASGEAPSTKGKGTGRGNGGDQAYHANHHRLGL